MTEIFTQSFRARWTDMDFNQHMRNAAFLGAAEDTRMTYLNQNGWPLREFQARQIGPVVLEDKMTYKRELHLHEHFRVTLRMGAMTEDGRRMKFRNDIYRESDDALCAIVESVGLWFDLKKRHPIEPPDELRLVWEKLARTEDFELWK